MTATLVAAFSIVGLAVGWLLDPVITRVPLRQPVAGPVTGPGVGESAASRRRPRVR